MCPRAWEAPGGEAAIERAKLEWESTADALAALVCMLSGDGKVVRANRVVEDWSLGHGVGRAGNECPLPPASALR